MRELIGMTDFVLEQEKEFNIGTIGWKEYTNNTINYAKFLKQPLELWMFVPCDEDGNVLEEPKKNPIGNFDLQKWYKYKDAKERCLFEGFEYKHIKTTHDNYYIINNKNITWLSWNNSKKIENLLDYNQDLQLTQTAIKKLGL